MTGIRGFSASLWPIRYKPLPDELLSSWLVRLAHGHGLKVQTFCNLLFGNKRQVWNRDIDRLAPEWLVETIADKTGTPLEIAQATTLKVFEGIVTPHFRTAGHVPWVLSLQMYHRKRKGFGQQYCPLCLKNDPIPYFRKTWRLALKTMCLEHNCMLLDSCWECGTSIAFHRVDIGESEKHYGFDMRCCHACGSDLSIGSPQPPKIIEPASHHYLIKTISDVEKSSSIPDNHSDPDELSVLRHLAQMTLSGTKNQNLLEYLASKLTFDMPAISGAPRASIESQSCQTRHSLLSAAIWIRIDAEDRIKEICKARAARYNQFLRDFEDCPQWYRELIEQKIPHKQPGPRYRKRA